MKNNIANFLKDKLKLLVKPGVVALVRVADKSFLILVAGDKVTLI